MIWGRVGAGRRGEEKGGWREEGGEGGVEGGEWRPSLIMHANITAGYRMQALWASGSERCHMLWCWPFGISISRQLSHNVINHVGVFVCACLLVHAQMWTTYVRYINS